MANIELIWRAGFNKGFIEKKAENEEIGLKAGMGLLLGSPLAGGLIGAGMAKPGHGLKGALYGAAIGSGAPLGATIGSLTGGFGLGLPTGSEFLAGAGSSAGATAGGLGAYYAIKKLFGDKFIEETFD